LKAAVAAKHWWERIEMNLSTWQGLIEELWNVPYRFGVVEHGSPVYHIKFDAGLTDEEVTRCEQRFGFRFPLDLREFLQTALPSGPQFPDWRGGAESMLREWLDAPRQGVLFDVEHNGLWLDEWGHRPESTQAAIEAANALVLNAPKLIPIFSHRMIPDEPHMAGNPVLSVHQSDIIYYGFDLADYLQREFRLSNHRKWPDLVRPIRFWDVFLS
jgi:hypothetical protein